MEYTLIPPHSIILAKINEVSKASSYSSKSDSYRYTSSTSNTPKPPNINFNFDKMIDKAKTFATLHGSPTKGAQQSLAFYIEEADLFVSIKNILKDWKFQADPKKYLEDWKERRDVERKRLDDWRGGRDIGRCKSKDDIAFEFIDENFKD